MWDLEEYTLIKELGENKYIIVVNKEELKRVINFFKVKLPLLPIEEDVLTLNKFPVILEVDYTSGRWSDPLIENYVFPRYQGSYYLSKLKIHRDFKKYHIAGELKDSDVTDDLIEKYKCKLMED